MRNPFISIASIAALLLAAPAMAADTGVSDARVNLPEGPGSLEGIGENASVNESMGAMELRIEVEVPEGFPAMTPELALGYHSGAGNGLVGMGWSMATPSIERTTFRGLPEYDLEDGFAADGGRELVRVSTGANPVYRERFEGSFVQYTWVGAGDGTQGYWTAEYPDGRIGYFGADAEGTPVDEARAGGPIGTFRWSLVEMVDTHDHAIEYTYTMPDQVALPLHIGWVFEEGDPRYEVTFQYQGRPDVLSDGKGGYEELLENRLTTINVLIDGTRIRRYELSYEDESTSGGFSRLASVRRLGLDDSVYPAVFDFEYSEALGADCDGTDCEEPYLVEMGSLGASPLAGRVTLIDLNGDGLPDAVDTTATGAHQIFINRLAADGTHEFDDAEDSAVGTGSAFQLGGTATQILDVNGDGYADLLNAATGQALITGGAEDWVESISLLTGGGGLPDFAADGVEGGELNTIRFLDYDNDRRIDVIRSTGTDEANDTQIFRNMGDGFEEHDANVTNHPDVSDIELGFESDRLQLADMNGDGLLDPVQVTANGISYRINLGWGQWGDWVDVTLDLTDANLEHVEIEDINGDAVADVLLVEASVKYWLNRNDGTLDAEAELVATEDLDLPSRTETTTVLYADMNASGSTDVVWIDQSGLVTYLELFPLRPNLLTRVTNGIGAVTDIGYSTNVEQAAAADAPWDYRLPYPMVVVADLDVWDELSDVHDVTTYRYENGYFDSGEKQFRGYEQVVVGLPGDETQEAGEQVLWFDVGAEDRYFAGRQRSIAHYAVDGEVRDTLRAEDTQYDDCEVALPQNPDHENLAFPVRYICTTSTRTTHMERVEGGEWAQTDVFLEYDGYGNVTRRSELGETSRVVDGGCEPCTRDAGVFGRACGEECLGDEHYEESEYIVPGADTNDRWLTNLPHTERTSALADFSVATETRTYYDGDPFVGDALGEADRGNRTRVETRVDETEDSWIDSERNRFDAHGNIVETLNPVATAGGDDHRVLFTMSSDGLRVTQTEHLLEDAGGAYRLRRQYTYDAIWDRVASATDWVLIEDGEAVTPQNLSFFAYDVFGRLASLVRPGDTVADPTEVYTYVLESPVSTIRMRRRSEVGGDLDEEMVRCIDGRGRAVQERTRIGEDRWIVDGLVLFNAQSQPVRQYLPFEDTDGDCDVTEPTDVPAVAFRYDAMGRRIETLHADEEIYGSASVSRIVFEPLAELRYDPSDTDQAEDGFDTPQRLERDGLDRLVAVHREFEVGSPVPYLELTYDAFGNLSGFVDAEGNSHRETFDEAGRVVHIDDPNRGESTFIYDDNGNIVSATDAGGTVLRMTYDGLNRLVEQWDDSDRDGTLIQWSFDRSPLCDATTCSNGASRLVAVEYPLVGAGLDLGLGGDIRGYDGRGNEVYRSRTLEDFTFVERTVYDNIDRVVSVAYPDGQEVVYERDDAGRITAIPGFVDAITYTERGEPAAIEHSNGVVTTLGYDDVRRLTSLTTSLGQTDYLALAYTLARTGEVLEIDDTSGRAGRANLSGVYTYDAEHRLVGATLNPGDAAEEALAWTYDGLDNIVSATSDVDTSPADVGSYSYDGAGPNAVTRAGDLDYAYDDTGNLVQRGATDFEWDHVDRNTRAAVGDATLVAHLYGAETDPVMRLEAGSVAHFISTEFEVDDGISSVYVRYATQRLARSESAELAAALLPDVGSAEEGVGEADGLISAGDAWLVFADGEGLVDAGAPDGYDSRRLLWSSARRLLLETGDPETHFHADHLGSIVAATAGDGELVDVQSYYPYGSLRVANNGTIGRYGFTGQEYDPATGFWTFQTRAYDPLVGRWISPDPEFERFLLDDMLELGESSTAYAYVANQPTQLVDPDGRGTTRNRILGKIFSPIGRAIARGFRALHHTKFAKAIRTGIRHIVGVTNAAGFASLTNNQGGPMGRSSIQQFSKVFEGRLFHGRVGVGGVNSTRRLSLGQRILAGVALTPGIGLLYGIGARVVREIQRAMPPQPARRQ